MGTDSAYLSMPINSWYSLTNSRKCDIWKWDSVMTSTTPEKTFFSRECCKKLKAYDQRFHGLFNVEAEGKAMIALGSKTHILKRHNDVKFSPKRTLQNNWKNPLLPTNKYSKWDRQNLRQLSIQNPRHHLHLKSKERLSYFYCKHVMKVCTLNPSI